MHCVQTQVDQRESRFHKFHISPSGFKNRDCSRDFRRSDLATASVMVLSFILIQNRQGKTRLAKWYSPYSDEEKVRVKGEVHRLIAPRDQKHQSNFVEFRSMKIVYRRYAGLFFCVCVDANDNELAYLEAIHFFVEVLDAFFGNVCELDLVFNFYKVRASKPHFMHTSILTFLCRYMRYLTRSSLLARSRRQVNRSS